MDRAHVLPVIGGLAETQEGIPMKTVHLYRGHISYATSQPDF